MSILIFSIHSLFMLLITVILLFSTNYWILTIIGIVLLITLYINYKIEDCPISKIEDIYSDINCLQFLAGLFIPEKYNTKTNRPFIILNLLWMAVLMVTVKVLVLLNIRTFKLLTYL